MLKASQVRLGLIASILIITGDPAQAQNDKPLCKVVRNYDNFSIVTGVSEDDFFGTGLPHNWTYWILRMGEETWRLSLELIDSGKKNVGRAGIDWISLDTPMMGSKARAEGKEWISAEFETANGWKFVSYDRPSSGVVDISLPYGEYTLEDMEAPVNARIRWRQYGEAKKRGYVFTDNGDWKSTTFAFLERWPKVAVWNHKRGTCTPTDDWRP